MATAAIQKPSSANPPLASPETKIREKLGRELHETLIDLMSGGDPPAAGLAKKAARFGQLVIGFANPLPPALNLRGSDDGELVYALFGPQRRLDVWIDDDSGRAMAIGTGPDAAVVELEFQIEDARRVLEWLAGRSNQLR